MLWQIVDNMKRLGTLPRCSNESSLQIHLQDERVLDCLVYTPEETSRGSILMIHGMNPKGNADPKWVQLCRLFCNCGFTVYSPYFESIASYKIEVSQIDLVELCVLALSENPLVCSAKKLKVVSVSFSVGIALLAAGRISIRNRINGIFAIGGVVDFPLAVQDCLYNDKIDQSVSTLLFYNFKQFSKSLSSVLEKCVSNIFNHQNIPWNEYLSELSVRDQNELTQLMTSPHYRRWQWSQILTLKERSLHQLNPKDHLQYLSSHVYFLHGQSDSILTSEHSRIGAKIIGKKSSLCITPLIFHGTQTKSAIKMFLYGPSVVRCLWNFLSKPSENPVDSFSNDITLLSA